MDIGSNKTSFYWECKDDTWRWKHLFPLLVAGIKPFACFICSETFTRQHSLNYHMLIHNNQNRFTCKDCGRKFRHPSHFKVSRLASRSMVSFKGSNLVSRSIILHQGQSSCFKGNHLVSISVVLRQGQSSHFKVSIIISRLVISLQGHPVLPTSRSLRHAQSFSIFPCW